MAFVRYKGLDQYSMRAWAMERLDESQITFLRTENAMCCVVYEVLFWRPREIAARMVFLVNRDGSNPWEPYRLLKEQLRQAKGRGCKSFSIGSETGIDLGAFARRLGLIAVGPSYKVEF